MSYISDLIETYGKVDFHNLGNYALRELRDNLMCVKTGEINTLQEAKDFLLLINHFRSAIAENDKLHGDNYTSLLESILSVGEDGLYSNNLRFIFELIQNVDDCQYNSINDCNLDIKFEYDQGKIILSYNEVGFTPENVFAITGIAEAAKNISGDSGLQQIGEKGIGFKSVFGVASKVHIESGLFSFELNSNNFTVPIPKYENYLPVSGTKMTLYVGREKAESIYRQIADKYCVKDALFNNNPLLFLNKLTHLHIYFDYFRSMDFHVSREKSIAKVHSNDMIIENDVTISCDLRDYHEEREVKNKISITASRYTFPIKYNRDMCISRYGAKTKYNEKNMSISIIIPSIEDIKEIPYGSLYSFLPTQVKLSVPIICHVPFKLDGSREYVDPQNENLWFKHSCYVLGNALERMYINLSHSMGYNIVSYLPTQRENIFSKNNSAKVDCLKKYSKFTGASLSNLSIFKSTSGKFLPSNKIYFFNPTENISNQEDVYKWLNLDNPLFLFPEKFQKFDYGMNIISNVHQMLLNEALSNDIHTNEILSYLSKELNRSQIEELFRNARITKINQKQVKAIISTTPFGEIFKENSRQRIAINQRPRASLDYQTKALNLFLDFLQKEGIDSDIIPIKIKQYLQLIDNKYIFESANVNDAFPASNVLLLYGKSEFDAFTSFVSMIEQNSNFSASLRLQATSRELNKAEDRPDDEYLDTLIQLREHIYSILGKNTYRNFLGMIQDSGSNPERFLQEILQNADDCKYEDVVPSFKLSIKNNTMITSYNEYGFTKENIRAITSIGDSTKKQISKGVSQEIGEKGVGFKSVFAIADKVNIRSRGFNFSLRASKPTVPINLGENTYTNGTSMEFILKKALNRALFSEASLLNLCMCLRQLKDIEISGTSITIEDTENERIISINGKSYKFQKFIYSFTINDQIAIEERENSRRKINKNQKIVYFIPEKNYSVKPIYLYTGLPTQIQTNIPLIIDAPYHLTTARDQIINNSWNTLIREKMYLGFMKMLDSIKQEYRMHIFDFFKFEFRINPQAYLLNFFTNPWLNDINWENIFSTLPIVPTISETSFSKISNTKLLRYPKFICTYLKNNSYFKDVQSIVVEDSLAAYDPILNALKIKQATPEDVYYLLKGVIEEKIDDDSFRKDFYSYWKETFSKNQNRDLKLLYQDKLKKLSIIPILGFLPGTTVFIKWEKDKIYTKRGVSTSNQNYYFLNLSKISIDDFYAVFGEQISELNEATEVANYAEELEKSIKTANTLTLKQNLYFYLLNESKNPNSLIHNAACIRMLIANKENIPFINELNEMCTGNIFVSDQVPGYFESKIIKSITVHQDCKQLAKLINLESLKNINYYDLPMVTEQLNEDDIESFQDDYFRDGIYILKHFIADGLISDNLIKTYQLEGLADYTDEDDNYDFPVEPIKNIATIKQYINNKMLRPALICKEEELRVVNKVIDSQGSHNLDSNEIRQRTMSRYEPSGRNDCCFCQMCQTIKIKDYIEVNNLDIEPKYFIPEMRISLCLECSKKFESLRRNDNFRKRFFEAIKSADVMSPKPIEIPIGDKKIMFTQKHLAEIQEILKNPKMGK